MNVVLFFTIVAWIGIVVYGLGSAVSIYLWYHYEHTTIGKLEQLGMMLRGQYISSYKFERLLFLALSIALLVSLS